LRRALHRERRQIGSIVLTIRPTTLAGEMGYRARLRVWSHYLGTTVVSEMGHTVRTTVQQVTARARHAIRRKLHKRLSRFRRLKRNRIDRWVTHGTLD
jgi:hypothetical protein